MKKRYSEEQIIGFLKTASLRLDRQDTPLTSLATQQKGLGAAQCSRLVERRRLSTPAFTGRRVISSKKREN
jgi:hypothetical protein